jgi:hypothetical protein
MKSRKEQRGTALSETILLIPLLMVMVLVMVDFGRLVYASQILVDLTRESANLVSRGGTADDAFLAASRSPTAEIDVLGKGGIIVTEVKRKGANDATPWVVSQSRRGPSGSASRVGKLNGPATVPNVASLETGVTIFAVEIIHPFTPVFKTQKLGINPYPDQLYDVAFF